MTDPKGRAVISLASLLCCLADSYFTFSKWGPQIDLGAYAASFVALLFATAAFVLVYPLRKSWGVRILLGLEGLAVAFWGLEFFGGVAWFVLDKVARHYQKR